MSTDVLSSATEAFPSTVAAPAGGDARTSASVRTPMQSLINGVLWLRRRLEEVVGKFLPLGGLFPVAASVSTSTFTIAGHGLSANDPVMVMSVGGAVPSPLVAGTTYYAVTIATDTFQVSATSGGGAITLTDNGTGSIYVAKRVQPALYNIAPTGSPTFSGTVTLPDYPTISPVKNRERHVTLSVLLPGGASAALGTSSFVSTLPSIAQSTQTSATAKALIRMDGLIDGQAITAVKVTSAGVVQNGTLTPAVYHLYSYDPTNPGGGLTSLSNDASDDHDTGNWGTVRTTTITPTTGSFTVDTGLVYVLGVVNAFGSTGAGANIEIFDVECDYALSKLGGPTT